MVQDMAEGIFEGTAIGKAALQKYGQVPENFRIFEAGWLGERPEEFTVMEVKGALFREAKSGPNKGKLTIMLPRTTRRVYVTKDELKKFDDPEDE